MHVKLRESDAESKYPKLKDAHYLLFACFVTMGKIWEHARSYLVPDLYLAQQ